MKDKRKDLRVRKTESSIKEAFVELQKTSPNKITVKALCEMAQINKTTFYAHYETIDDLILQMEDESIDFLSENILGVVNVFDEPEAFFDELVAIVKSLKNLNILPVVHPNERYTKKIHNALEEKLAESIYDTTYYRQICILMDFIFQGLAGLDYDNMLEKDINVIKSFFVAGICELKKMGVDRRWEKSDT